VAVNPFFVEFLIFSAPFFIILGSLIIEEFMGNPSLPFFDKKPLTAPVAWSILIWEYVQLSGNVPGIFFERRLQPARKTLTTHPASLSFWGFVVHFLPLLHHFFTNKDGLWARV
jgi:surface polysaccharide O-acyltransferase-like enzyme